jgi:hypothetical protein
MAREPKPAPPGHKTTVTIEGDAPDLNQLIGWAKVRKGKWSLYQDKKKGYHVIVWAAVRNARPKYIHHSFTIETTFYTKNRRKDPTNLISAIEKWSLDGMADEQAGLIAGDGWKNVKPPKVTYWEVDKENPRVEITLTEVGEDDGGDAGSSA